MGAAKESQHPQEWLASIRARARFSLTSSGRGRRGDGRGVTGGGPADGGEGIIGPIPTPWAFGYRADLGKAPIDESGSRVAKEIPHRRRKADATLPPGDRLGEIGAKTLVMEGRKRDGEAVGLRESAVFFTKGLSLYHVNVERFFDYRSVPLSGRSTMFCSVCAVASLSHFNNWSVPLLEKRPPLVRKAERLVWR